MKKYISVFLFLLFVTGLTAQENKDEKFNEKKKQKSERRNNRIESKKIGFITEKLDLSSDEAQKFWPIYNELNKKMKVLRKGTQAKEKMANGLTDENADIFLNSIFEEEQKKLELKKEYFKKMETALPKVKIAKLYILERTFRDNVYQSIKRKIKRKKQD